MHASVPYRMIDGGSSELKVAPLLDMEQYVDQLKQCMIVLEIIGIFDDL